MSDAAVIASPAPAAPAPPPPASGPSLWSHDGFGFKDLLDIVNPLQHLPIIGSVYRYLTGDELSGGARIVGDTIYGGPIGFGVGVVSTLLTDSDGRDLGEKALAAVFGPPRAEATAVAKANPQPASNASQAALPLPQSAAATATRPPATTPLPADPTRLAAQLYRSPPPQPAAQPGSPEQKFLAQTARFQRQLTTTKATDGRVLNNRPVPLELSGNLLPARRLDLAPATGPRPSGPPIPAPGGQAAPPALNPIARKMLDALDKYERLKKQQAQEDSLKAGAQIETDLSL
ncbi:MAG: hypothetical protein ACREFL_10915 [Stellaceae bacterium]